MHLSLQTDYALRILMALAASGQQMSVEEIARRYGISRNHLAKVAHRLQTLELVKATRGRGGGLMLAKPPEEINVGWVVRSIESLDSFVECMQASAGDCPVTGACGLQGALTRALVDFLRRLDKYQLSDLTPNRQRFVALLEEANLKSAAPN